MGIRHLVFKSRFCNTLEGATDQDVVEFAEKLEELFPCRPEIIDPLKVAKKLPRVEHRFIALRRAVECVINNLLLRNMEQGEKVEFQ